MSVGSLLGDTSRRTSQMGADTDGGNGTCEGWDMEEVHDGDVKILLLQKQVDDIIFLGPSLIHPSIQVFILSA